ncbi:MAG: branched-chain amino acid aminotransferase [Planctomycetota bacterium]
MEHPTVEKADLDWPNLTFSYTKTDYNVRMTWRNGKWSEPRLHASAEIPLSVAATCLHYGQAAFEGLKVFEDPHGRPRVFRVEQNARRMIRTAEKVLMAPVPEELFIECVLCCVKANLRFVPPHGSGASLYVRPLLIGTGSRVGVMPADEYTFVVLVTPVGAYFKTGFKPVDLIVETKVDRAAPLGVGDVKVAGNYAAGMRATKKAKDAGFADVLYLDAREKKYIDESGPANFFGITRDDRYVTPDSESILPSIINMSLRQLAKDMGMKVEQRHVHVEEIFDFVEAGCCGTAAVITPVRRIVFGNREVVYSKDGKPGRRCQQLYETLRAIQDGDRPDPYGWMRDVPLD